MEYVIVFIILISTLNNCQSRLQNGTKCDFNNQCICVMEQFLFYVDCTNGNITNTSIFPSNTNVLILQSNNIMHLLDRSFENLSNLLELDLSNNKLLKIDSEAFIGLSNLKELSLGGNELNFTVNSFHINALAPLKSLTILNITYQTISDILSDKMILNLHALQSLETDIISNTDGQAFGKGYSSLKQLRQLKAGKCQMELVNNNTFSNLPYLEFVELSKCRIVQFGNGCIFCHLKNFRYLDLSKTVCENNNFRSLVSDFKRTKIRKIKMTRTFFTSAFPPFHLFGDLANSGITELYINKNSFVMAHDTVTDTIPNTLQVLDLSDNMLVQVSYSMLTLRTLNLRNNDLGKVLAKGGYKRYGTIKLQNVDLSNNGIHSLLFIVFEGHSYLETLNLSDNALSDFSPDVSVMIRLKVLDLSKKNKKIFTTQYHAKYFKNC
ncbi:unnamed protein product [Mytilus coruscus]|uniref:LRRNT domain-containing protein n=1 Tax=Mytilus coruscus TaxID=42192 RepID=A0A6J8CWW3_MYTCO|nr:unnamed protein product [Mytilus coruscus]